LDPVYERSVAGSAAFVRGKYFFASADRGKVTMRLNFTTADSEDLGRVVAIIGRSIEAEMPAA